MSFDWNQIRAFHAVVEQGSLSAAARVLGQTQPTIGRQIAALEAALGVALFERSGRSVALTETGAHLVEHVRAMADAAARVSLTAAGQAQDVAGTVRITASDMMAAWTLPRVARRLSDLAPGLEIEIVADDALSDLLRREADIAIRHSRPEQPDLIARLVRDETASFYAASDYLDRRGRPESFEDLAAHDFVSFNDGARMLDIFRGFGAPLTAENFRHGSRNAVVAWEMVREGLGLAIMSDAVARETPEVERAPANMTPISFPIWLVAHRELRTSRRVRLVYDALAAFFAGGEAALETVVANSGGERPEAQSTRR